MESNTMTVKTPYGNVYGIETLEEAERILAKTEAERNHEDCEECRGQLSLDECIAGVRTELATFSEQRENSEMKGNFTAREIALVARLDAWARFQAPVADPMADTAKLFGVK
jgi:hypothetical protein